MQSKINIIPYQAQFQTEIDLLMKSIGVEFLEPISSKKSISDTDSIKLPDLYLLAVSLDNKVVGTIGVTILEEGNSALRKMFLHKNYRGQGIAKLLLQNIVNWSLENNLNTVYLGTMTQFVTAQKFYEKHHFEKISIEQLPKDFPINPIDSIFYKLNLIRSL